MQTLLQTQGHGVGVSSEKTPLYNFHYPLGQIEIKPLSLISSVE